MINHRERFPRRCWKKYKDEMTTDGIRDAGCWNLKIIAQKKYYGGRLNKYSVGKRLLSRIE